jgi:3'-phosphoadenosine 5'-phosphosulfate sulfotransferase (PAPS reductase)/FAD synthetase
MKEKIYRALLNIEKVLEVRRNPFILWSGGKDSMALLDLVVNKYGMKMPVVFFREPWQPHKYAFQNRVIEEWGLEAYTFHPRASAFQQTDDEFEVQNYYWINNTPYTCPSGITPPEDHQPWACALDMVQRPKQHNMVANWDVGFVGHKACDSDPIYGGDAGTRIDCMINPGHIMSAYPMRDWSHDDVFKY